MKQVGRMAKADKQHEAKLAPLGSGVRCIYEVTETKLCLNEFPNYSCDPPDPAP